MNVESAHRNLVITLTAEQIEGLRSDGRKPLEAVVGDKAYSLAYNPDLMDPDQKNQKLAISVQDSDTVEQIVLGESGYWVAKLSGVFNAYLVNGDKVRIQIPEILAKYKK